MTDSHRSTASVEQILARLPRRVRPAVDWVMATWVGRSLLRLTARFVRVEMFDRSMTVAAQVFTSVFPILIMAAIWLGSRYGDEIAEAMKMPDETRSVLQEALANTGGSAFGVLGTLVVLISATSLSRALTRAFAAIWDLPRPKTGLSMVWRWLAAVFTLAASMVLTRVLSDLSDELPGASFWTRVVAVILDTTVGVLVPWILLSGRLPVRRLLPGAFVFGLIMLAVRPASAAFLPHALDVSAERYGTIGVAFTYIAWLYVLAFCFLGAALIGQVIVTDEGWLGRWIRGGDAAAAAPAVSPSAAAGSASRG